MYVCIFFTSFQALECEALVPLTLANKETKIILAGDHMQVRDLLVGWFIIRSASKALV